MRAGVQPFAMAQAFFESGTFSLEIPLEQYDKAIKYIYSRDREEIGVITQINYYIDAQGKRVNLSGYFMENELNKRIVYKKGATNIQNAPEWLNQAGQAESVALGYFNAFKAVQVNGTRYDLGISAEASPSPIGNYSDHYRGGEKLGNKLYSILKPSMLSYRVEYAGDDLRAVDKFKLAIWGGIDRTDASGNNPVTFSTAYGNINNIDLLIDTTEEKTAQ